MRAKYAAQIRAGVVAAISDVRYTVANNTVPPKRFVAATELEQRAYDRTMKKLVAKQVLASWMRTEAKLKDKGWIE